MARVGVVLALLLATSLSGCLGADDLFTPRTPEPEVHEPGILRLWFATNLADLPDEFAHVNVTLAFAAVRTGLQSDEVEPMMPVKRTVDLLALRREMKAAQMGQIVLDEGSYVGVAYTIAAAEVVVKRIVGTENGQPVYRLERYDAGIPGTMAQLESRANVFDSMVTDVYVEFDLENALEVVSAGSYRLEGAVNRVSVYLNNVKVNEYDLTNRAVLAEHRRRYGHLMRDKDGGPIIPPDPVARLDAIDARGRDLSAWENRRMGYISRAIGLGEELRFDATRSEFEPGAVIEEIRWDFGDGTKAFGSKTTKSWDKGGIYDITLYIRDEFDGTDTDVMTIFVPYTAEQARLEEVYHQAGTIVPGSTHPSLDGSEVDGSFQVEFEQFRENWTLGAYRITVDTHLVGDDDGHANQAYEVRLNVTSGLLDTGTVGSGTIEIVTAGVPTTRGAMRDWVDKLITIELDVVQGGAVSYDLTIEALYYDPLALGKDQHGGHVHGRWGWTDPSTDHLDHRGRSVSNDDGAAGNETGPLPI